MFGSRTAAFGCILPTLLFCTTGALAADYPKDLRGSYNWNADPNLGADPLSFEFGLRYIYSRGVHDMNVGGAAYNIQDTSHILEGHARIDDHSTSTFLRASAGMAVSSTGQYTTPTSGGAQSFQGGSVVSAGGDFGWMPLGNEQFKAGGFVGYEYMDESPDMGWVAGPSNRTKNALYINALRLGFSAQANFSDTFDISADAAIIPIATLTGTYGAFASGAASVNGWLYGASGQVMLGYHPLPNAIVRVGARASYLTGSAALNNASGTSNTSSLSFARIGAIAELTYGF